MSPAEIILAGDTGWNIWGATVSMNAVGGPIQEGRYFFQAFRTTQTGVFTFDFDDGTNTNHYSVSGTSVTEFTARAEYNFQSGGFVYAGIRDFMGEPVPFASTFTGTLMDETATRHDISLYLLQTEDAYYMDGDTSELQNHSGTVMNSTLGVIATVPVPGAIWLFGSGFLGVFAIKRRSGRNQK